MGFASILKRGGSDQPYVDHKKVLSSLRETGLAVVRNGIDVNALMPLIKSCNAYKDMILSDVVRSGKEAIDSRYNFNAPTYACDLTAIDPWTKDSPNNLQFHETLLYSLAFKGDLGELMQKIFTYTAQWNMGRVRIVFPKTESDKTGALTFHQERTVTRYSGVHNLWVPLTDPSLVTNVDTTGIQFYSGERDVFTTPVKTPEAQAKIDAKLRGLNDLPGSDPHILRPELSAGDFLIFDNYLPHASYIPPAAKHTRVSLDIRIFPRPDDVGPKPVWP